MRRARRIRGLAALPAAALLALGGSAGIAPAQADVYSAPQPPDPSYLFSEIGQVFTGTFVDLLTPGQLDYFVKAGILTNVGRLAQPFEDLGKPETWHTPAGAQGRSPRRRSSGMR